MKAACPCALTRARSESDSILRSARHGTLRRKCACGGAAGPTGECETCRRHRQRQDRAGVPEIGASQALEKDAERAEAIVVRGAGGSLQTRNGGPPPPSSEPLAAEVTDVLKAAGKPLDAAIRKDMERRFGHDFSRVRVLRGWAGL